MFARFALPVFYITLYFASVVTLSLAVFLITLYLASACTLCLASIFDNPVPCQCLSRFTLPVFLITLYLSGVTLYLASVRDA